MKTQILLHLQNYHLISVILNGIPWHILTHPANVYRKLVILLKEAVLNKIYYIDTGLQSRILIFLNQFKYTIIYVYVTINNYVFSTGLQFINGFVFVKQIQCYQLHKKIRLSKTNTTISKTHFRKFYS